MSRSTEGASPTPRSDVEWIELDGEVVIYDPVAETLHLLNGSAARVWSACDGAMSVDALVARIKDSFVDTDETIDRDVRDLLERLIDLDILRISGHDRDR